ncbi:MAG TPA: hypothetical protein VGO71_01265 [Baekduia sp.]|jgi:hypothetical protein|nr:hypothetical protein [Baekduia sp.]
MVVALLALFVALDGPATAARLIDGRSIKANSITNKQIRNGTLGTQDLSKTALKRLQATPAGSITASQLARKSVDASKLADAAVGSSALAPGAVDAGKLTDGAIGPGQLAAGAVTAWKIADGAVGAAAVADGGLQTRDVGDFYGSVSVNFKPFAPNTCQVAKDISPQPSAPGQGNMISDDVVSVSPSAGWPDPLVVSGNPGAGNTLRIVACRIGSDPGKPALDPTDLIDPDETVFQYVAFDTP